MHLKKSISIGLFIVLFFGIAPLFIKVNTISVLEITNQAIFEENVKGPEISSITNSELLNSLFDSKIGDYDNLGYFPNVYESSLQSTYYALFILDAIGKINVVNQTQIIGYIMSYYDPGSNSFIDKLAKRYQDTDFSLGYFYPLTSVLQTTSYAILSLNILGQLGLIDIQGTINFIWSCYVTTGTGGGFMGQTYDAGLDTNFKIPTLDNTYFAILTLDILMTDWFGHTNDKDAIIQLINDLQLTGGSSWDTGSFLNDEVPSFDSISPLFEPNLLSSYYAIKTLEIFGAIATIDEVDFNSFLAYLYDSNANNFRISEWDYGLNYTNIVATAIGLELSNIMNFSSVDNNSTLAFILDNRNSIGNWDGSLVVPQHELIDTFQVIRSLKNLDKISQLSFNDTNEIGNATQLYYQYAGYSHLSRDFTSMNQIFTLTSAYELFDRIFELDIQPLYSKIKNSYDNSSSILAINSFSGYLLKTPGFNLLRSHPIEFFTSGKKNYIQDVSQLKSHKSTYYALVSLENMFKLDDFASAYNLMDLFNEIIETQFLNYSYPEAFGGFTSVYRYEVWRSEFLSKKVFFEYSYYAIQCLELISDFLGLGDVNYSSYGLDEIALFNFIEGQVVEDSQYIYLNPQHSSSIETKLEYTYYMIWMLKALNLFNKDLQKIKNFIESNVDYTNIKNIYYSFKISEILDLRVNFDAKAVQELAQAIYSEQTREFYISSNHQEINHEVFLWICEMAKNSKIGIEANYLDVVTLGGYNNMSVSLYNLILRDFGLYISFKFVSDQLGSYTFNKLADNFYVKDIHIPFLVSNYPKIYGNLTAYEGSEKKIELEISFRTTYSLLYSLSVIKTETKVSLTVNSSILASERHPLTFGEAYINEFINDQFKNVQKFTQDANFSGYSIFALTYIPPNNSDYRLDIYLDDGFQDSIMIGNITNKIEIVEEPPPIKANNVDPMYFGVPLSLIFIPGVALAVSTKQLNKLKRVTSRK